MPKEIIFTDEEQKDIISMRQKHLLIDIAKKYRCSNKTISRFLKKLGFSEKTLFEKKCDICKKTFTTKKSYQKYCHNPCAFRYKEGSAAQQKSLEFYYIKIIRRQFWDMLNSNPKEALDFEKQMEKEEGTEFKDLVLGEITQSDEFNERMEMYQKYKRVYEEG